MARAIILNPDDNVATLVDPGSEGDEVALSGEGKGTVRLLVPVDYGHKVATRDIGKGDPILKYGIVIGRATQSIRTGQHVHLHNVEALRGRGDKEAA
ncbi:(2R)-sulfolactate sulfo-lyase subunit alpha (plasmid) [Variovorax sp. SRS16]|uniref:UxaA family hydrolase n=1 Tax=Variovorax sp. SRS16 TaxID=282217 RepID=UPI001316C740|nr:UxaA family hydrolase [Variovorax sp. SRS16]VTU46595.1 (2R)-sulfolactate sulfo-lyase subunit alpha [Variovorax sp. SRS16]